jgi:hypothetical protein
MRLNILRTGTADTGGSTTTLKDAPLQTAPDDFFNGAHLLLTSGSPTYTELLITDFVGSTGVCTFRPTLGAAPDALTYEILPCPADRIHSAISDTLTELAAEQTLMRTFWTKGIVAGSPAYNADFGYWAVSTVPHGYTVSSGTVSKQTTVLGISDQNMQIIAGTVVLADPYRRLLYDLAGETVYFGCWVYATGATQARISLTVDGSTNYSSYHDGDSGWQLLVVEIALGTDLETITPTFVTSGTSYFSDWFLYGSGAKVFEHPWVHAVAPTGPEEVRVSTRIERTGNPPVLRQQPTRKTSAEFSFHIDEGPSLDRASAWLRLPRVPNGSRLWCRASAPLTLPTANTSVIEVTPMEATLVAKRAAVKLLQDLSHYAGPDLAKQAETRISQLTADIVRLTNELTTPRMAAELEPW